MAASAPLQTYSVSTSQAKVFKVIVVGDSGVGKTCLSYRFCEGNFLQNTEATIGVDFRTRELEIDDEKITLQLWDTAGQERFRNTMVRHYYREAHAIVFVYDVTNARSFENLRKWIDECNNHSLYDIPRIIVGNKCDGNVAISTNTVQKFADQFNMPVFQTSAKIDSQYDNIEGIFLTLAHKLKSQKQFLTPSKNIQLGETPLEEKEWNCCYFF